VRAGQYAPRLAASGERVTQRLRRLSHLRHVCLVLGLRRIEIGSAEGASSRSSKRTKRRQARQRRRGEGMRPLSAIGRDPASDTSRRGLDDDLELAVIQ